MKRTVECIICGWKEKGWILYGKMLKHLILWHPELATNPFCKLPFKFGIEIRSKG